MHLRPQFKSNSSSHTHDSNLCRIRKDNCDVRSFLTRLSVYPICVPLCNEALADLAYRARQIVGKQRTPTRSRQRKAEAQVPWGKAFGPRRRMKRLEDQGAVERVVVPDTDDAIANEAPAGSIQVDPWAPGKRQTSTCSVGCPACTKPRPPTVLGRRAFQPGSREVEDLRSGPIGFPVGRGNQNPHPLPLRPPKGTFARARCGTRFLGEGSLQGKPPLGVLGFFNCLL